MREGLLKANGNLARRPVELQVLRDPVPQPWTSRQHTALWPASTLPSARIGLGSSIRMPATVAGDLAAHRRSGPAKAPGNLTQRQPSSQTSRDLFPLINLQNTEGATAGSRFEPAVTP